MKLTLKFLYLLTLAALCLCVTSVPASAVPVASGTPPITNTAVGVGTSTVDGTQLNWTGVAWEESSGYTVNLDATATCQLLIEVDPACAGTLGFSFNISSPAGVKISVIGASDDPTATGTVTFNGTTEGWSVDGDGNVVMTPFSVGVPGSGDPYFGEFTITSLAPNDYVELPVQASVPEPGSALLLGAGIVLVAFLRRKVRG